MSVHRGAVWWGPAPHKSSPAYRPWVLVSDSTHPFSDTESIAIAMTTQHHDGAIPVSDGDWERGGSEKDAFVSPWYVTTLKHRDLDRQQGVLTDEIVRAAVTDLYGYTASSQ